LEPYGALIDLAHCWSAHRSGIDDSGPSVHEALAATLNRGVSSGRVRGYVGAYQANGLLWTLAYNVRAKDDAAAEYMWPIVNEAIQNLVRDQVEAVGLEGPTHIGPGSVSYAISKTWLERRDPAEILSTLAPVVTAAKLQAEIDRLVAAANANPFLLSPDGTKSLLRSFQPESVTNPGDDERQATGDPNRPDPGWGNDVGHDFDRDANPSSSKDDPNAADNPADVSEMIISTP
jgi:hypothetical protein